MSEELTATEPVEEVASEVTPEQIDELPESELDAIFEKTPADENNPEEAQEEPTEEEDSEPEDLNERYARQISDPEIKLDKPVYLKVNGQVIEVDSVNDLRNMAEQSLGAQAKFREIAKYRDTIRFLESNGLDKDTLAQILQQGGYQAVEPDPQEETAGEVEQIAQRIIESPFADEFKSGMAMVPDHAKEEIVSDPRILNGLAVDFSKGIAQRIMPHIAKEMAVTGLDFVSAYQSIGKRLLSSQEQSEKQKQLLKSKPAVKGGKTPSSDVNIWEMDEKEFEKYFETL